MATLVWFRRDLRLADQPALHEAVQRGMSVIPVFIWEPDEEKPWQPGSANRWWLHHSLMALDSSLRNSNSRLIVRRGPSVEALQQLVKETGAAHVVWNRCYEPSTIKRDEKIKKALGTHGISVQSFNGSLLYEPMFVKSKENRPYQVFTPFWKSYQAQPTPRMPLPVPMQMLAPEKWPDSLSIESLQFLPAIPWDAGFYDVWKPGEKNATERLRLFVKQTAGKYNEQRDYPGFLGTSRLSPSLHFGEISPHQVWHAIRSLPQLSEVFLKELVWREFAYHLLYHFPHTTTEPLRDDFKRFPWGNNKHLLKAWQSGETGYPMVDAGMRQLWKMGWMHNRVRMIVASFLVKHLLIPWQRGVEWFWDTLVDADLANNTLGWQWTAGCGADAAPYFRIFNPIQQGERFDADGSYVREWVPELAQLPDHYLHAPWTAPESILTKASVVLGKSYPKPIVDHIEARKRALKAYDQMRSSKK